jgi:hypothetical protein
MTGIEKVADKASLVDTSKTSTTSAGGDINNDKELREDYIEAMKESHKELVDVMWKIIYLLIIQLCGLAGTLIAGLIWALKFLLKADERRDIREEKKLN